MVPRARKMPAFAIQEMWKRNAERDARAMILMRETGCSFQDAWLADSGSPAIPLSVEQSVTNSGLRESP